MDLRFCFILTGSNCELWAARSIESIVRQRGEKRIVVACDGSTDGTERIARATGVEVLSWAENRGAAYARWRAIGDAHLDPEDVVVLLDLDDWLEDRDDVLEVLARHYSAGAEVTYGSHRYVDGPAEVPGTYQQDVLASRLFRLASWRCWPLRTFRARLGIGLPRECFTGWDGKWLPFASDLALMIPVMERAAPNSVRFVPEILYVYNRPNTTMREVGRKMATRCNQWVRALPSHVPA